MLKEMDLKKVQYHYLTFSYFAPSPEVFFATHLENQEKLIDIFPHNTNSINSSQNEITIEQRKDIVVIRVPQRIK